MSIKLNESNYDSTLNSNSVVLVDFYTTWCGPCRMLAPILEQLTGAVIAKVDGDVSPELVNKNNIRAYPTIIFFKNGAEVNRLVGVSGKQQLQSIIDNLNT